jgi:hypothetical protein
MHEISDQNDVILYEGAICLPPTRLKPRGWMRGGVFDQHEKVIKASLVYRYNFPVGSKPYDGPELEQDGNVRVERIIGEGTLGESQQHLTGHYIFAGHFMSHYGHFLLETLSRLWFIKQYPRIPIVFIRIDNNPVHEWHLEFFEKLGVRNEIHWIEEQTVVDELLIPDAGYIIASRFWESQAQALALVGPVPTKVGKKVWLSRSDLNKGVILNEHIVEAILVQNGWTIYHPQHDSFDVQLEMLADAEIIAGIEGSAFHSLVLMPHFAGKAVLIGRVVNGNYDLIADKHGINQKLLDVETFNMPRIPKTWDNEINRWWRDIDVVLDEVGAVRPIKSPQNGNQRLFKIVNSLCDHFKLGSLLELWATSDSALSTVKADLSLTVSDNFALALPALKAKGVRYFDIAPDVFLATGCLTPQIDLFCFRADKQDEETLLHTFYLALEQAHIKSIWVLECGADDEGSNGVRAFLKTLLATNPAICVAWVADSDVAIIWRARRPMALPKLHFTRRTDLGQSEKPEIPRLGLNAIAVQIKVDRGRARSNSL